MGKIDRREKSLCAMRERAFHDGSASILAVDTNVSDERTRLLAGGQRDGCRSAVHAYI